MVQPLLERPQVLQEGAAEILVQDAGDELSDGLVIGFVRVEPTGVDLGLVQRLDHVLLGPLHELGVLVRAAWTEEPGAEECLVKQILLVRVGYAADMFTRKRGAFWSQSRMVIAMMESS